MDLSEREPLPIDAPKKAEKAKSLTKTNAVSALVAGTYEPKQRWSRLLGGGNGIVYAIQADGRLFWYRHAGWAAGVYDWSNGFGREIGSGWQDFVTVLADVNGGLYGVYANGDVLWYQWILTDPNSGDGYWANGGAGVQVGSGFNQFPRIFGGPDGVIWTVDERGGLYRSKNTNGVLSTPTQVGSGFSSPRYLMADTGGVVYSVNGTGGLSWFRYRDDTGWVNFGVPIPIGDNNWFELTRRELFAGNGNGAIYLIRLDTSQNPGDDETLVWLRMSNHLTVDTDGGPHWLNFGSGVVVGHGFTVERSNALQGYPKKTSVTAGTRVSIPVSTTFSALSAQIVRVAPGNNTPVPVTTPVQITGQFQALPANYRSAGCGWSENFGFTIPTNWASGIYAAKLIGNHGRTYHIPFIVRPAVPAQQIAVVLPTNTYLAYNGWGGHDQYSGGQDGVKRTLSFQRPSYNQAISSQGQYNVELFSDLILLRWMSGEGIGFDCYTDYDLHLGQWLSSYKAIVLGTHPEYYSLTMRTNLANYLNAGGRVIASGANNIYERAEFNVSGNALVFRDSNGNRDNLLDHYGLPASQLLGATYEPEGWMTLEPYEVVNDHALLQGTGLSIGSTFGTTGFNGAASGWEFDTVQGLSGDALPGEIIARGTNNTSHGGAVMLFKEKPHGGFVFNASSLTFNGAIPDDPALRRLLRNVFDRAVL